MTTKSDWFKRGCREGMPICLGYLAVSFAFGIAAEEAGLTVPQAVVMSLTNLTSAGQFSSLEVIAANGALAEMALLQLIINLRYLLMSTALSQKLSPKTGTLQRMGIAYGVTDEIFGLSVLQPGMLEPWYSYGLIVVSAAGWTLGTFLGAFAGQILPQILVNSLGVAIYGMFLAIVIPPAAENRAVGLAVILAMAVSTVFTYAPVLREISSGMRIILITVGLSAVFAKLFPREEEASAEEEGSHA